MNQLGSILKWLLYGAIFFACFAFAINNQHDTTLRFFFGSQWRLPLVLVVLMAFALGLVAGMVAMMPRWWLARKMRKSSHGT
jgi:lipopolysaccharide assembly protein A